MIMLDIGIWPGVWKFTQDMDPMGVEQQAIGIHMPIDTSPSPGMAQDTGHGTGKLGHSNLPFILSQ
jgi:hypothetical protein